MLQIQAGGGASITAVTHAPPYTAAGTIGASWTIAGQPLSSGPPSLGTICFSGDGAVGVSLLSVTGKRIGAIKMPIACPKTGACCTQGECFEGTLQQCAEANGISPKAAVVQGLWHEGKSCDEVQCSDDCCVVDIDLTVDNVYALYRGTDSAVTELLGHDAHWPSVENYSVCLKPGERLYVAAWSDGGVFQGFLSQVSGPQGTVMDGTGWEVFATGIPLSVSAAPPTLGTMTAAIANTFIAPVLGPLNGVYPGLSIPALPAAARWIWHESGKCPGTYSPFRPGCKHDEFLVFRFDPAQVCEEATGACCTPEGCLDLSAAACAKADGTFNASTSCAQSPALCCDAAAPPAACCLGAACDTLDECKCLQAGGSYAPGQSCDNALDACCDNQTLGACCTKKGCLEKVTGCTCDAVGGQWYANASCQRIAKVCCSDPTLGACCFGDQCKFMKACECAQLAGSFNPGVTCKEPGVCCADPALGACCVTDAAGATSCHDKVNACWCEAKGGAFNQGQSCADDVCEPGCCPVDIAITADNFLAVYTGTATEANAYLGTHADLKTAANFSTCLTDEDEYVYVAAWSDKKVYQGLLGQFTGPNGTFYLDHPAVEVLATGININSAAQVPTLLDITSQLGGMWGPVTIGNPNANIWPIPFVPGIDSAARWAWYESGNCPHAQSPFRPGCNHDEYLIFRIPAWVLCGEPPTACCVQGECIEGLSALACAKQGGVFTEGATCAEVDCCPDQTPGACCNKAGCTDVPNACACDALGGWFQPGVACGTPLACCNAELVGACCRNGDCQITDQCKCALQDGTFTPGASCADVADTCCPSLEAGACCIGGGDPATGAIGGCIDGLNACQCAAQGGTFHLGEVCESGPCEEDCCGIELRITADNFLAVYTGTATQATELIGTHFSWPTAGEFTVCVPEDAYIYVAAWSDKKVYQGLIGELVGPSGTLLTGNPAIEVFATGVNISSASQVPSVADISTQLGLATFGPAAVGNPNATIWPMAFIPGISPAAHWIWYESGNCPGPNSPFSPGCNHDEYLLFRIPASLLCGDETGACCTERGCFETTKQECEANGGVFSAGQGCDEVNCCEFAAPGACCLPEGCTEQYDQCICEEVGGTYYPGLTCEQAKPLCCQQQPPVACCFGEGLCDQLPPCVCEAFGGQPIAGSSCKLAEQICCPDATLGACCTGDDCTDGVNTCQCKGLGGTFYPETTCAQLGPICCADDAVGACCTDDGCKEGTNPCQCEALGGTFFAFQGCAQIQSVCCPQGEVGACCNQNPATGAVFCEDGVTSCQCDELGGTLFPNATCKDAAGLCCPDQTTGSCCVGDGCFDGVNVCQCNQFGGLFKPFGSCNDPFACCFDDAPVACCLGDACETMTTCACGVMGGTIMPGFNCDHVPNVCCSDMTEGACCTTDGCFDGLNKCQCADLGGNFEPHQLCDEGACDKDCCDIALELANDNFLAVYTGTASQVTAYHGNHGSWSQAKTFEVCVKPGEFVYIAGWSDNLIAQGLVGQATGPGGSSLSGAAWLVHATGIGINSLAQTPSTAQMTAAIATATYGAPAVGPTNASWYFGQVPTVDPNAHRIWYESGNCPNLNSPFLPGCDHDEFLIFRLRLDELCVEPLTGACCLPSGAGVIGGCVPGLTAEQCQAQGGQFTPGASCDEVSCCDSTTLGACCVGHECYETVECQCEGEFFAGKSCEDIAALCCPDDIKGACCFQEVTGAQGCLDVPNQCACDAIGGLFTPNLACGSEPSPCCDGVTLGACCVGSECYETVECQCQGDFYAGKTCEQIAEVCCPETVFGACCTPHGCTTVANACMCAAVGGQFTAGVKCEELSPGECCVDQTPGGCCYQEVTGALACDDLANVCECEAMGGTFSPLGWCDEVPSPCCDSATLGACCLSGQCVETVECECQVAGGSFFPGDTCGAIAGVCCPELATGACCTDQGCLDGLNACQCDAIGGTLTLGTTCQAGACDQECCEITFTGTTDNFMAVYVGDDTAAHTYVGNGTGPSATHQFTACVAPGEFLYIAAWSDKSQWQGTIGQLDGPFGQILTGDPSIAMFATGQNLPANLAATPSLANLNGQLGMAAWGPTVVGRENSDPVWPIFTIPGVQADARWIWNDTGNCPGAEAPFAPGCNHGEYILFRLRPHMVCEEQPVTGACCLPDVAGAIGGCAGGLDEVQCLAWGGDFTSGASCDEVECCDTQTFGACCIGNECFETVACECQHAQGDFGPGLTCAQIASQCCFDDAPGACCFQEVTGAQVCAEVLNACECDALGGSFSAFAACDDVPSPCCDPFAFGACCLGDECVQTNACECQGAQGELFLGQSCQDIAALCCPDSTKGACCYQEVTGAPACADVPNVCACDALGGVFTADLACGAEPSPCCDSTTFGACCVGNECFETVECECESAQGEFFPGQSCQQITPICCPDPTPGACCTQQGCVDGISVCECDALGGTFTSGATCHTPGICAVECCPVRFSATLDNFMALYLGSETQAHTSVGLAAGPAFNQQAPFWDLCVAPGEYLYVAGWSDWFSWQGFLATIAGPGGTFHTGGGAWELYATGQTLASMLSFAPSLPALNSQLAVASWSAPAVGPLNVGPSPPVVLGVDPAARWIWYESGKCPGPSSPFTPGCNHEEYLIFRVQAAQACGAPSNKGSCCLPSDTGATQCLDGVEKNQCDQAGGLFTLGGTCANDPCPQPNDLCCVPLDPQPGTTPFCVHDPNAGLFCDPNLCKLEPCDAQCCEPTTPTVPPEWCDFNPNNGLVCDPQWCAPVACDPQDPTPGACCAKDLSGMQACFELTTASQCAANQGDHFPGLMCADACPLPMP